jgi:hypothetical protein
MDLRKQMILTALRQFVAQRPGLEFGNYGDTSAYRSELRTITKDLNIARTLFQAIEWRDSITAEMIFDACKNGRIQIVQVSKDGATVDHYDIDYTTGQYWPTEYRAAVCRLLSSVLWAWMRDTSMPDEARLEALKQSPGDYLRASFKREFGASIARRFFS